MSYQRTLRVEGDRADSGSFPMTLATEGEASDGHILSIAGGKIPRQMPLLSAHWNDPDGTIGSVIQARKETRTEPKELKALGIVELGGEGAQAEKRRDLYHMIEAGHIDSVSIRWDSDPEDAIPRIDLPKDHPFYVSRDDEPEGSPRRWGLFFKKWRALEGSVVPIGADAGAKIGRMADELEAEGASEERIAFCRALAADAVPPEEPEPEPEEPIEEEREAEESPQRVEAEQPEAIEDPVPVEIEEEPDPAVPEAQERLREMMAMGLSAQDIVDLAREIEESDPEKQLEDALARISALEAELAEVRDPGRVNGEPSPPSEPWMGSISSILTYFSSELEKQRSESLAAITAVIDEKRGKVTQEVGIREELAEVLKGIPAGAL